MSCAVTKAAELWCPMVRVGVLPAHGGPAGINDPTTQFSGTCVGDRCAMWRWSEADTIRRRCLTSKEAQDAVEPERPLSVPADWEFCAYDPAEGEPSCWVEHEHVARQRRHGYCGLAGRPVYG